MPNLVDDLESMVRAYWPNHAPTRVQPQVDEPMTEDNLSEASVRQIIYRFENEPVEGTFPDHRPTWARPSTLPGAWFFHSFENERRLRWSQFRC